MGSYHLLFKFFLIEGNNEILNCLQSEVGILYVLSSRSICKWLMKWVYYIHFPIFKYIELITDTQTNLGHFLQDDIVAPDDIGDLEEEDGGNVDEDIAEGGGIDMPDSNR